MALRLGKTSGFESTYGFRDLDCRFVCSLWCVRHDLNPWDRSSCVCAHQATGDIGKRAFLVGTWHLEIRRVSTTWNSHGADPRGSRLRDWKSVSSHLQEPYASCCWTQTVWMKEYRFVFVSLLIRLDTQYTQREIGQRDKPQSAQGHERPLGAVGKQD